jgi:hypothetical protein
MGTVKGMQGGGILSVHRRRVVSWTGRALGMPAQVAYPRLGS